MSLFFLLRCLMALVLLVAAAVWGTPPSKGAPLPQAARDVPTMDEMTGDWMQAATLRSLPALNSSQGSGQATGNVLAIGNLSYPPLTMPGDTGRLAVDGQDVDAQEDRWYPYGIGRRAELHGIIIETEARMPYTERGILFHVTLHNAGVTPQTVTVTIGMSASFTPHTSWGWDVPRDPVPGEVAQASADGQGIDLHDPQGKAWSSFRFAQRPDKITAAAGAGTAAWTLTLAPGEVSAIDYAVAVGTAQEPAAQQAQSHANSFTAAFAQVKTDWQTRFDAMFQPRNSFFSGNLPALVTSDLSLRRVYYMSALCLLSVCRTCFPLAARVYVSNSPEDNCTMVYFWDTREWATALALLDPAMMKQYLVGWLQRGIYSGYAEEFLTGSLQGPWYSANDMSVFVQLDTYVNVTGDRAFLSQTVNGKTVLQWMISISTNWKRLVGPNQRLADYGSAENLLECVPTYTHEVASFNAANVWMMRRAAALAAAAGDKPQAAALRADASALLPAVLALYQNGQGFWAAQQPDGTKNVVRTVVDFVTVGQMITPDLTPAMRAQMTDFVQRELITDHWMRALSLEDAAAPQSDRPDHGPFGAFSAWPAETAATFCAFGNYDDAVRFLDSIAAVTSEGPFSQSREILVELPDSPVRIAERGWQTYNVSSGGAFCNTIIVNLFGYEPDILTGAVVSDAHSRGFRGSLHGLRHNGRFYTLTSTDHGIQAQ